MVYAPFGQATVSLLAEVPEDLHDRLKVFLDKHPRWSQERVFNNALALFLMQNSDDADDNSSDRVASRIYLDTLFDRAE